MKNRERVPSSWSAGAPTASWPPTRSASRRRSTASWPDFASLTTYLRFPTGHHGRIRHSNFIERTFGETRRRVKVIGRLPGERTCLGLVWAVLDRASRGWRGVVMTPVAVRHLQDLRRQLFSPTAIEEVPSESTGTVTAAA